ncbi:MAG: polyprenyl synthetase family protein [Bacteroidales bacterium]|nr:polyprenyl synthetase family protein [Bacteroidales bacterium]
MTEIKDIVSKLFADIQFEKEPAGLYDPLRYMISIGGKRIRPTLCLLTYLLYRDDINEAILEPAAALEVFHSFTLIHDDIMDKSPLRRGQDTVWKKWNEDTAILSGDVMQIDAYKRLAKAPADKIGSALDLFSKTAAQVCEGQQYDMEFENRAEVKMEDYAKMIGLKTAVLIACSAKMGALIAGAPDKDCEALYRYGYELGMAFQVADDYLDAFGDEKVFGKPIGGDIVNKKKSWLTVRTLEKTSDKKAFLEAMELPAETPEQKAAKIAKVKAIYVACGVDKDAKAEIVRYSERAMEAVKDFQAEPLRDFAEKLVGRAK